MFYSVSITMLSVLSRGGIVDSQGKFQNSCFLLLQRELGTGTVVLKALYIYYHELV